MWREDKLYSAKTPQKIEILTHWNMDVKQRLLNIVLLSFVTVSLTGCSSLWDQIDESIFMMRTKGQAKKAWNHSRGAYRGLEHNLDDFGQGFVAGYVAVASGGDGCPPALPPRKYWKTKYSTPGAKKLIIAWFDGYHHGAAAAMADGVSASRRILTSGEIYHKVREHVEYEPSDQNYDSPQDYPEVFAPMPEPVQLPEAQQPSPVLKDKEIPLTPPAKPYVPKEADKKK